MPGGRFHLWERLQMPWRIRRDRLDVYHGTYNTLPPRWPLWRGPAMVVSLHDLIVTYWPDDLNDPFVAYARKVTPRVVRDAAMLAGATTTVVCVAFTAPARESATKVTGVPTPLARAICVESVAVRTVPSVQLVVAMPLAFVGALAGDTLPPPASTLHEISTPSTGLFSASRTTTVSGTGSVAPTVSTCASPVTSASCVAPPTVAVTLKVTLAGPPASVALATVVLEPARGPSVRVALARPSAFVIEVSGATVPPPSADQLTVTPATGFPVASVTRTS
jgi:hypothetical protein